MTASFFYPACCGIVTAERREHDRPAAYRLSSQSTRHCRRDQAKNNGGRSLIERLPALSWPEDRPSRARIPQEPRAAVLSMAARRDDAQGWRKTENADRTPRSSPVLPGCQPEVNNCGFKSRSMSQAQPGQDRPMLTVLGAATEPRRAASSGKPRGSLRGNPGRAAGSVGHRRSWAGAGPESRTENVSLWILKELSCSHAPHGAQGRGRESARHQRVLSPRRSSSRTPEPGTSSTVARRSLRASYVLGRAAVSILSTVKELI